MTEPILTSPDARREFFKQCALDTLQDLRRGHTPVTPIVVSSDYQTNEFIESTVFLMKDIKPMAHPEKRVMGQDEYVSLLSNREIEVTDEDSVAAAMRVGRELDTNRVAILNMASSSRSGGGFLKGASAQEESLCRRSTLIAAIEPFRHLYKESYVLPTNFGKPNNQRPLHSDIELKDGDEGINDTNYALLPHAIFSPRIQFFRTAEDDGFKYMQPFTCDVISSPAYRMPRPGKDSAAAQLSFREMVDDMYNRIRLVFHTAIYNRCDALVLGAWGCGAYGLDPHLVASLFKAYIYSNASLVGSNGLLDKIVFAIKKVKDNYGVQKDNLTPFKFVLENDKPIDFAALYKHS